jgi:hypothetical protein
LVVGPRDLEANQGMLKDLATGEQVAVALDVSAIIEAL